MELAHDPPSVSVGDAIFARLSKVGMYYAATVTAVNADEKTLSVDFRDLKKGATVPHDWVMARERTDARSVLIPHEVGTSRSPKEAKPPSFSPVGGERRKLKLTPPPGSPPTAHHNRSPLSPKATQTSSLRRGTTGPTSMLCTVSPALDRSSAAAVSPPVPTLPPQNEPVSGADPVNPKPRTMSPPLSLSLSIPETSKHHTQGGPAGISVQKEDEHVDASTNIELPKSPLPQQGGAPGQKQQQQRPLEQHQAPPPQPQQVEEPQQQQGEKQKHHATSEPYVPAPSPMPSRQLARLPPPPPEPPQQTAEEWYKAEFGDLLAYTPRLWGATEQSAELSCSQSLDLLLSSTMLLSEVVVEPELLAAEFNICSSHVRDIKEMLQSVQSSITITQQLYETSQRDMVVASQELRQQLETLQALPPPPPPAAPPSSSTLQDASPEGVTHMQRLLQEHQEVIRHHQEEVEELLKERDQLRRELAAVSPRTHFTSTQALDRGGDVDPSASVPLSVARSLEAKLKASEQARLLQQQQQQQTRRMTRAVAEEKECGGSEVGVEDKSFLVSSLEPYQRLVEHTGTIRSIAVDAKTLESLFSASDDMTVRVWTLRQPSNEWKCTQVLTAHDAPVQVICLSSSGTVLFSGDALGTILIWAKSDGGRGQWTRKGAMRVASQPSITCLVWSQATPEEAGSVASSTTIGSNAGILYSGSMDGVLRSWKYLEKRCAAKTKLPGGPITCMHEYSRYLAVGHAGGDLALVTQHDLQLLRVAHEAHTRKITAIVISSHKMFTASHDSTIKVWLLPNVECLTTLMGHYSRIECLAISKDEDRLYSGSADMSVMSWDLSSKCVEQGFVEHTDSVTALYASLRAPSTSNEVSSSSVTQPNGKGWGAWLFSGAADMTLQVWKASDEGFLPQRYSQPPHTSAPSSPRAATSPITVVDTGETNNSSNNTMSNLWHNTIHSFSAEKVFGRTIVDAS